MGDRVDRLGRTAVILLLAFICGGAVGTLTFFAGTNIPAAILAGLTATGGSIVFLHKVVG
ncbi:hypothetical protein ABZU76_38460 [Amycolatopsis sp. NPDC005232]|uniref:hypothetical protein n=1 Tax=Amycolatopsis sp. NPDC005232 TaxID=3157027 RepID=UPI0033AE8710